MWGHVRSLFFVEYREIANSNPLLSILYFLTGFGHQAVIVFFVLSGFLISSSIFKACAAGKWSWAEYGINRLARLYVVLIPGLLFGLLWDYTGAHLSASSGLYTRPLEAFGGFVVQNNLTAGNFFGNLFFLQTIVCSTFGSNGPLWSLANEFWYYILFPLTLFAGIAWVKHAISRGIVLTLLAMAAAYFVGWTIFLGFFIWLAGTVLVLIHGKFRLSRAGTRCAYLVFSLTALSLSLSAARLGTWGILGSDLTVGLVFTVFLFSVLQLDWSPSSEFYSRTTTLFAGFSYSLYVLHFPLVLFLRAWIAPMRKWQPDPLHLICGFLLGTAVMTFAWMVSLFTEKQTSTARNWMRGWGRSPGIWGN